MSGLQKLGLCRDGVTKAAKLRNSACIDIFHITFPGELLVGRVGNAENFQLSSWNLRGVGSLEALLDVIVSGVDQQELLAVEI